MPTELTRRYFLKTAALGSAGLVLARRASGQTIHFDRKPNLLVFLPDQFRADMLACSGARYPFAPNLDKLAGQACVFQRAYVTQPVCTPSRSSLMTGLWPHQNGCVGNAATLKESYKCFPELLGDADYRTGYLGKWHLGHEFQPQHGFTEWASIIDGKPGKAGLKRRDIGSATQISDYAKFLIAAGKKPKKGKEPFDKKFIARLPFELSRVKFLETKACDFLQRYQRDPFILFVAFYEPHPPYDGPFNNVHPLSHVDLEPTFGKPLGEDAPERYRAHQMVQAKLFAATPDDYRKLKQHYLGLVTEVDKSIGAILTKLEQLGLTNNTVVMHSSDHGEMMGAHGLFEKSVMYEESARVPFLVRLPGQTRKIDIVQPYSHIDFVPTLLDLLGKPAHEQCAGTSRASLMKDPSAPGETIFAEWGGRDNIFKKSKMKPPNPQALRESTRAAMAADGWKLCLRDLDKNELYNLREDPHEEHNLYHDAKYKDVIAKLSDEIHRWQERTNDHVQLPA